jgi:hypothetical protein
VLGSLPLPREALSKNLQNGLFSRLSLDRQKELCGSVITIGAGSADAVRMPSASRDHDILTCYSETLLYLLARKAFKRTAITHPTGV